MTTDTALIQAVEQADSPGALVDAVRALAAAQSETAIPTLIAALGYNNPGAAIAAVEGLVQLGAVAVAPLLQNLDAYNYGARAYAIRALAAIADPRALELLLNAALNDFAPSVRRAAAKGLGQLHWQNLPAETRVEAQTRSYGALVQVGQHPDWDIRYAGVVGLQALATQSSADLRAKIEQRFEQMQQTETDPTVRSRIILANQQLQPATLR